MEQELHENGDTFAKMGTLSGYMHSTKSRMSIS